MGNLRRIAAVHHSAKCSQNKAVGDATTRRPCFRPHPHRMLGIRRVWAIGRYLHGPTKPYCKNLDGGIGPAPGPNGSVGNYQRVPALAIARQMRKRTCGSLRQMEPLSFCLGLSFRRQFPQETTCYPNCPGADKPRCLFATGSSHFHGSVLNCIRSADRSASKYSRKWFPEDQLFHVHNSN